jgi:hypothetical protein
MFRWRIFPVSFPGAFPSPPSLRYLGDLPPTSVLARQIQPKRSSSRITPVSAGAVYHRIGRRRRPPTPFDWNNSSRVLGELGKNPRPLQAKRGRVLRMLTRWSSPSPPGLAIARGFRRYRQATSSLSGAMTSGRPPQTEEPAGPALQGQQVTVVKDVPHSGSQRRPSFRPSFRSTNPRRPALTNGKLSPAPAQRGLHGAG